MWRFFTSTGQEKVLQTPISTEYGTALPGSPVNGQPFIFTDSLTAPTYYWHLRYNSTTTKWHFIGGIPLFAEVTATDSTTSTTYAALTPAGPSITLPLAGDYDVEIGFRGGPNDGFMSYDIGATGAVDADAVRNPTASGLVGTMSVARARRKTDLSAVTLMAKYKWGASGGANTNFADRWMRITPIRMG